MNATRRHRPIVLYAELFLSTSCGRRRGILHADLLVRHVGANQKPFSIARSASIPMPTLQAEQVHQRMSGKRIRLAVASKRPTPGAARRASCINL
ncbi:hypothetical protein M8494_05480 [Serratia ureilytica]